MGETGWAPISCVLMDIEMPILDGIATIRIIRPMQAEQALKGHISTLAVTANARAEQIQTMELAGLYGIISKPFKVLAIIARIPGVPSGGPG